MTPGSSASPPTMSPRVWVGNDDSSPTRGVTGGTLPAYIWRDAMLAAEQGQPVTAAGPLGAAAAGGRSTDLLASGAGWDGR